MTPFFKNFMNRFIQPIIQNSQYQLEMKENNDQKIILKCTINSSYANSWCNKVEPEGNMIFKLYI